MTDVPDARLLEEFARNGSEEAFAALVERHIALVYSVAMRHTANPQFAQDITQAVFIILARKAGAFGHKTVLPGWLYHTARLTAANIRRAETRRVRREQEAFMQYKAQESTTDALWRELSPQLDEAMAGLGTSERDALVLRYFQNKSMAEVGKFLGLEENTAQKRVSRALEKLRKFFVKRGVSSTAVIIAGAISANSVQAVPAALAKSVTAVAITKGAAASGATLTLIKGALKIMAWTKAKTAIVVGAGLLLVAGTATITVKEIQAHRHYPWQVEDPNRVLVNSVWPQVKIVPTVFSPPVGSRHINDGKIVGTQQTPNSLLGAAYQVSRYRVVFLTEPPVGNYDFIANLKGGEDVNSAALQREIEKQFHLVARKETREADVLILTVKTRNAPGLTANTSKSPDANIDSGLGYWRSRNVPVLSISERLEKYFKMPVIDHTGLTGRFNVDLKWDEQVEGKNPDAFKQVLLDQLGLELVPSRESIEMLVVEKAK